VRLECVVKLALWPKDLLRVRRAQCTRLIVPVVGKPPIIPGDRPLLLTVTPSVLKYRGAGGHALARRKAGKPPTATRTLADASPHLLAKPGTPQPVAASLPGARSAL